MHGSRLRRMAEAAEWLERIHALKLPNRVRVLNVCGGHERSIGMAGLRSVLPDTIELIPGPGCPVCVCPEEDILAAIQLAATTGVILVAFGDMLRVPANVARGELRSLAEARGAGADVRAIASPQEAVAIARGNPDRRVVFFVAGFETTAAPVAAMIEEGLPDNLSLLMAVRRTWPAVALLLQSEAPGFEGLIAPGHVATVMGAEEWRFVVDSHAMPTAVAGFTAASILAALYSVLRQVAAAQPFLDNSYPEFVRSAGNARARACLAEQFDDVAGMWRGIGVIPGSGFALKPHLAAHDAAKLFPDSLAGVKRRVGAMPPGCDCARVVMGRLSPVECRLYGRACTPHTPVGPCMVSDEGACRIWWASGRRPLEPHAVAMQHALEH
jgi:hydrogenase expression/formation protein HypD